MTHRSLKKCIKSPHSPPLGKNKKLEERDQKGSNRSAVFPDTVVASLNRIGHPWSVKRMTRAHLTLSNQVCFFSHALDLRVIVKKFFFLSTNI